MRCIQLLFRLDSSEKLKNFSSVDTEYFAGEAAFRESEEKEIKPLLAIIERNVQKFPDLRFSMVVTAEYLRQAKQWSPEIVKRLSKLSCSGHVEFLLTPSNNTLSWFYDTAQFEDEIRREKEALLQSLNCTPRSLAMPNLIYNDKVATWAKENHIETVVIGAAEKLLDFRTTNAVYESLEADGVKLLPMNSRFTDWIMGSGDLQAKTFLKDLEIEMIRGGAITLVINPSVFSDRKDDGIIRFFDELIANWIQTPGAKFVTAEGMAEAFATKTVLGVKKTISIKEEVDNEVSAGVALLKDVQYSPPRYLSSAHDIKALKKLYAMRDEVLATKRNDYYEIFARLGSIDYTHDENYDNILNDFYKKVRDGQPAPPKIEAKADTTKKREKAEQTAKEKAAAEKKAAEEAKKLAEEYAVKVVRIKKTPEEKKAEAKKAEKAQQPPVEPPKKDWDDLVWNEEDDWSSLLNEMEEMGLDGDDEEDNPEVNAIAHKMESNIEKTINSADEIAEAEVVTDDKPKKTKKKHKLVIE